MTNRFAPALNGVVLPSGEGRNTQEFRLPPETAEALHTRVPVGSRQSASTL